MCNKHNISDDSDHKTGLDRFKTDNNNMYNYKFLKKKKIIKTTSRKYFYRFR